MGRKGSWFKSMKKAMSPEPKEPKDPSQSKPKKKWFGKNKSVSVSVSVTETPSTSTITQPAPPLPPPPVQDNRKSLEIEEMQRQHSSSIAIATAKAAEAAMAAAEAAAELARLTNPSNFPKKLTEEAAAIRLQTAFRGYMARRALRALRGLARLKTLMQGPSVKRQTTNALKCLQALVKVQFDIHERRMKTTEENQTRQMQLLDKHGKELDKLQNLQQNEDKWNATSKSKEQIQARLQNKHEAAIRRERALAYSFNHQRTWRNSTTTAPSQTMFMDSINPHWGWSWLERWLAAKPWEIPSPINPDLAPLRSSLHATSSGSQIAKALLYHVKEKNQTQSATSSPRSSIHSPRSATAPKQRKSTGRLSTSSTPTPRVKAKARVPGSPMKSEQSRRRSDVGDVDNESLASSTTVAVVPSYMAATESARARSIMGSPNSADRMSACSGRRRVSYPSSPARSRRSTSSITDANSVGDGK